MPWTLYANWSGPVTNRPRMRLPPGRPNGAACFGLSRNPLMLRPGAVGILIHVLPAGAAKPAYVRFPGPVVTTYAGEFLIRRADNSPAIWNALHTDLMGPDETTVLIPRATLDQMEIEY